jgi:hypothetical protein
VILHGRANANEAVVFAWRSLPARHKQLLESIGASQWQVVRTPLGTAANEFLESAGERLWLPAVRRDADRAFGVWLRELRIVLIRDGHPKLAGLNDATLEEFIARVAWHEWGHALSIERCPPEPLGQGRRLLELAPPGIGERIREAGYRVQDYTHEVIAETYALLMLRRIKGGTGKPSWLDDEIYGLMQTTTDWTD